MTAAASGAHAPRPAPEPRRAGPDARGPTLWGSSEYRRWLLGDLALSLGAGIGSFAFPLITLMATGSLRATGLVGMAQGIGGLVGMLPGGLLADRCDRRRLRMLAAASGAAIQAVLILVLLMGWGSALSLAALAFSDRLRGTLLGSASHAMLKQIVPPALLPRAFAVNEGREAAVELGSGPLGGLLVGISIALPPLAQLLGNLGSLAATWRMRGSYRPRSEGSEPTRVRDDLRDALAWALGQRARIQLFAVAMAVNLGSSGLMLTVLLDLASQGVPAERIGLLTTVMAASILCGAIAAPRLVDRVPTGALLIAPVLVLAGAGVLVPFAPSIVWIGAAYAVMGFGIPALNAAVQGFFMHITPVDMQGRLGALMGLVGMGLMPLAPAVAGWGLERAGELPTMLVFVAFMLLGAIAVLVGQDLRRVPVASGWGAYAKEKGLAPEPDETAATGEGGAAEETAEDAPLRPAARDTEGYGSS